MPSLQHIRRRIGSVKNTQKITRAMKLVSGAKLRRAQDRILAARPYAEKMAELLRGLSSDSGESTHPLLVSREERKAELIVVTADRGLCGSFNAAVVRKAQEVLREKRRAGIEVSLTLIGRKGRDFFRRRPYPIRKSWVQIFDRLKFEQAAEIARDIEQAFLQGDFDACDAIYTEFRSAASQKVVLQRFLPVGGMASGMASEETQQASSGHLYEPSEDDIFARLLPKYGEVQIFRALLESNASEQGARMMAMDAATRNAQEMIGKLTQFFNKTRQAAITKELMDIIGGAEALK